MNIRSVHSIHDAFRSKGQGSITERWGTVISHFCLALASQVKRNSRR